MDIKCHDFLECDMQGCIMFKEGEERNCWDVEPELLSHAIGLTCT